MIKGKTLLVSAALFAMFGGVVLANPGKNEEDNAIVREINQQYTLVEKGSSEDIASLQEVLDAPPKAAPKGTVEIEIRDSLFPQIAYYLEFLHDKEAGTLGVAYHGQGGSTLLNNKGYFLTAYHVFEESLKERENGNKNHFMLIYNTAFGFALPARTLVYSKEKDILLGKVDLNASYPIETIKISSGEPVLNSVFALNYDDQFYVGGPLLKQLLNDEDRNIKSDNGGFVYENIRAPTMDSFGEDIKLGGFLGNIASSLSPEGELNCEPWESIAVSEVIPGDSGSSVTDPIDKTLQGVVTQRSETVDGKKICIYTDSSAIREMIQYYMDQH